MSEYVSKEELKKFFESIEITVAGRTRAEAIGEVLQAIYNGVMELPTTDAAPIRKGTWTEEYDPNDDLFFRRKFRCSACGHYNTYGFCTYCPDCGAKMENARKYDTAD